jgi:hypothetical protein
MRKKIVSNNRQIDPIREARASLNREFDRIEYEMRARARRTARIIHAAKGSLGSLMGVSDQQIVTEILADLRHFCDHNDLAFHELDKAAFAQYLEAKADELPWLASPVNLEDQPLQQTRCLTRPQT